MVNLSYINGDPKQMEAFMNLPLDQPFQMLNLLKFKNKVLETGQTGAEAYSEYMKAVYPLFIKSEAKIVYQGKPMLSVIGPEQNLEWDKVLIVEYLSKQHFIKMVTDENYPGHLRSRALDDSRLILCTKE